MHAYACTGTHRNLLTLLAGEGVQGGGAGGDEQRGRVTRIPGW